MAGKTIEIGGQERPIAFPAAALREFERITGEPFLQANGLSYDFRIAIAYVGLKWGLYKGDGKEPKVDFNELQVSDWIGLDLDDESVSGKILQILTESLPKAKEKNVGAGSNPA